MLDHVEDGADVLSSEDEGAEPLDESCEADDSAVDCESPPLEVGVAEPEVGAALPC